MLITRLRLKNWRNFKDVDVPLRERSYLLGANASGKSNFLDVFRFLRDVCKTQGGGLQKAIHDRGGIRKLRCLHARRDPDVLIEVHLSDSADSPAEWIYTLAFKPEGKGAQRALIAREEVRKRGHSLLCRPSTDDNADSVLLLQTALEQSHANKQFREIADFLAGTTYLHLVPQLLKYEGKISGNRLEDDPFGQGFLERIAKTPEKTRIARLKRIEGALSLAVPQFKELRFVTDKINGRPHLEALYSHHRPKAGWQSEEHFSDGTLRLLGFLWVLLEGDSLLLLEEPELSLNDAIVREIPRLLKASRSKRRQIVVSTHSEALLSNPGIDGRGILLLQPAQEGTAIRELLPEEADLLRDGLSVAEVVLPKARPENVAQLGLW